jgi:secreted Zn-dependent insulinase-like peptidase
LWDDEFKVPRCELNSARRWWALTRDQTAMAVLYASLISDKVGESSYPAALAGLNLLFISTPRALACRVGGYNDKQQVLLDRLIEGDKEPDFFDLCSSKYSQYD